MKQKLSATQNQGHSTNMLLAAGAPETKTKHGCKSFGLRVGLVWLLHWCVLVGCHDRINPAEQCGTIQSVGNNYFEVYFPYVKQKSIPPSLVVRYITDRPDTIVFGEKICINKPYKK